jgi:hypothetical protein
LRLNIKRSRKEDFDLPNLDSRVDWDVGIGVEQSSVVVGFSVIILAESVSVFNSGTHEFFSPWNAYAGTGPNLLSGPVAPSCGYMKVKILFVKSSSNIFLSVKKILT